MGSGKEWNPRFIPLFSNVPSLYIYVYIQYIIHIYIYTILSTADILDKDNFILFALLPIITL